MFQWESLDTFFNKLNEQEYIVLRSYENLIADILNGDDIDFLCKDKTALAKHLHAETRTDNKDTYNYYIKVDNQIIPIDIREVGDGYYDPQWETDMLTTRKKFGNFYVINDEDYKYSLLYHALIHKKEVHPKYFQKFENMYGQPINNIDLMTSELVSFMQKNHYMCPIPKDKWVTLNTNNLEMLTKSLKNPKG